MFALAIAYGINCLTHHYQTDYSRAPLYSEIYKFLKTGPKRISNIEAIEKPRDFMDNKIFQSWQMLSLPVFSNLFLTNLDMIYKHEFHWVILRNR